MKSYTLSGSFLKCAASKLSLAPSLFSKDLQAVDVLLHQKLKGRSAAL